VQGRKVTFAVLAREGMAFEGRVQHQPQELRVAPLVVDDAGDDGVNHARVVIGVGRGAQFLDQGIGACVARLALENGGVEVVLVREEAEDDRLVDRGGAGDLPSRRP